MKKAILLPLIAIIAMQIVAAAINVEISPKKAEFIEGDMLAFDYTISSTTKQEIIFIPHIMCPAAPVGFLEQKTANLNAGDSISGKYQGAVIEENVEPQECTASIKILSPEKRKVEKKLKIVTNPSLDITIKTCEDDKCAKIKRSFVKGSKVYLVAVSKVSPSVSATIIYPDGKKEPVAVPGSFTASQSGKYAVEVSSSKAGYKGFKNTIEIAVIQQAYTVPYADFSIKAGQAVVRPIFKQATRTLPSNAPAKKVSIRSFLSRVTGYFMKIF
ncbi:MAG TPA: hypothetical protein HA362_03650 [Nanoarchaeota archaeon]|nr:hypothetical protein [Nanoarchaeota archaeon]